MMQGVFMKNKFYKLQNEMSIKSQNEIKLQLNIIIEEIMSCELNKKRRLLQHVLSCIKQKKLDSFYSS